MNFAHQIRMLRESNYDDQEKLMYLWEQIPAASKVLVIDDGVGLNSQFLSDMGHFVTMVERESIALSYRRNIIKAILGGKDSVECLNEIPSNLNEFDCFVIRKEEDYSYVPDGSMTIDLKNKAILNDKNNNGLCEPESENVADKESSEEEKVEHTQKASWEKELGDGDSPI